jgi:hypothetical protein
MDSRPGDTGRRYAHGVELDLPGVPLTDRHSPWRRRLDRHLIARMGHASERAAMIYQHAARGAGDAITEAMDSHVEAEQVRDEDGDDGAAGALVPAAYCTRGDTKISKTESR